MTKIQTEQLVNENENLRQENRLLRQKVDYLLKKYFGGQKNEKINPKQLELLISGLEKLSEEEANSEVVLKKKTARVEGKSSSHGRRKLPEHLETEEDQ